MSIWCGGLSPQGEEGLGISFNRGYFENLLILIKELVGSVGVSADGKYGPDFLVVKSDTAIVWANALSKHARQHLRELRLDTAAVKAETDPQKKYERECRLKRVYRHSESKEGLEQLLDIARFFYHSGGFRFDY
jgi:hypothetical protein